VCRRRTCPGYAPIWAGDQRRKLFDNFVAYTGRRVLMVTVTAPGVRELPWDAEHCAGLGEHAHSGSLGCRCALGPVMTFNRSAPGWWRKLNGRCRDYARRQGGRPWMLGRVWEEQRRGALHVHAVFAYTTPAEVKGADAYVDKLRERAGEHGFGRIQTELGPAKAKAVAAYLSSYFVRGKAGKVRLAHSVLSERLPRSIIHISTGLTLKTGITMRELRFRRYVWVLSPGLCDAGRFDVARKVALHAQTHQGEKPPGDQVIAWLRERDGP
jgi:hypothetical protein